MAKQMADVGPNEHQVQTQAGDDSDDDCYGEILEANTSVDVW